MSEAYAINEDARFTYADYKAWELKSGERFELIDGIAYAMAAPNMTHQQIVAMLTTVFFTFLRGKICKVFPAPFDVRLFYKENEGDDTVVQPDITVICDEKKRGYEGCRGAPDLVIEILSPANTAIEMQRKLKLYQDAGVREYWIVDPENMGLTVYRFELGAILFFTYKKDAAAPVGIFPDLKISLEQVFAE